MKYIIILFLLICNCVVGFTRTIEKELPFVICNNSIIIQTKDITGQILNLLFDSGANDFLMSEEVISRLNIETKEVTFGVVPGSNTNTSVFGKINMFEVDILNEVYTSGKSYNFDWISKEKGMRIDGLIGMMRTERFNFGIDFKNNNVSIFEQSVDETKLSNFIPLNMIFSDNGFETIHSKMLHTPTAVKAKISFSESVCEEVNFLFDSGFNKRFMLLTDLSADSLADYWKTQIIFDKEKKTSLQGDKNKLYTFNASEILIGEKLRINKPDVILSIEENFITGSFFGSSKYYMLVGVDYLKDYKKIYFDHRNKKIYLVLN